MILRSVMKHVRDQNWFAVGLDFLIVVVGVFIGIQVANWNDERRQRQQETAILERLSEDTQALLTIQRRQLDRDESRARVLMGANPVLFGQDPARALTERECAIVATSHVLARPQDEIPVLDELLQTARFDIIRSAEIKARLRDYILLRERARSHFQQSTKQLLLPYVRHPEIVHLQRVASDEAAYRRWDGLAGQGYHWQPACDIDAMRASKQFLSEVVDNLSRLDGNIGASKDRIESVIAIQDALRSHLGHAPSARLEP